MARKKKSYNLILYELQQEELRKEALTGHKTASNIALENQAKDEYLAPIKRATNATPRVNSSISNNQTIKSVKNQKTYTKQNDNKFFKTGAFSDGYDFGDLTKTILGTGVDLYEDATKGLLKIGEGVLDTGAYLVGGGAKLIGQDDFANKASNFIKKDLVEESGAASRFANTGNPVGWLNNIVNGDINKLNPFDNEAQKDTRTFEQNSILGNKSDSIVQSAGQLAGTVGLQAVGVPWFVTTGVTSFGGGTQEAFQNDATYGEAGTYALISAGAEVLTEKLSGGISFGGKTLDAGLTKQLTKSISDKTIKTLTKYGIDMVGEAGEEVLTEVLQNVGKKLTYEDEKTWQEILFSEEAMEQYLDAAIGGAVLGGGANVGKVTSSIKTGRDYDTGLSSREQQVVDARVQEIVNEQQANGKTLTDKEIAKIEEDVITDIKKGYISTALIESTIGKKLTAEQEAEIEAQLNELLQQSKMETDPKTQQQIQEQIEVLENQLNTSRDLDLSQDGYLLKSYQEKELRKQNYTYEKTNNAIEDGLRESASKVMNNTTRSHELVDTVAKIAKDTSTKYEFTNTEALKQAGYNLEGKTVNGLVTADGKVLINIDSNKALETILGHETTHLLEGTAEYKALQDFTIEYAKQKGTYKDAIDRLNNLYKGTNADINAEFTADMVGDLLFTDQAFIDSLSAEKPNVFQRIYNYIKHIYKKATAGSKEARQLEDLKYKFDQAYKNMKKQTDTNTKYSVSESITDNQGRTLTKEQQEYFKDSKVRDENGKLQTVYHSTPNKFTVFDRNKLGGNSITYGNTQFGHFVTPNKEFSSRFSDIDEVGQTGHIMELYANVTNPITHPYMAEYKYSGEELDNIVRKYYEATNNQEAITILENTMVEEELDSIYEAYKFYATDFDIDPFEGASNDYKILKEKGYDAVEIVEGLERNLVQNSNSDKAVVSYAVFESNQIKNIDNTNPTSNPDIRYSLSEDTKGRKLSDNQKKYFKNVIPELKDENGNLKVLYHGTPNEFTQFNYNFIGSNGTALGKGFYLTDDKTVAEGYGNVMEVYANITKPMLFEDRSMTKTEYKKFVEAVDKATEGQFLSDYGEVDYEGYRTVLNRALQDYEYGGDDIDLVHGVLNTAGLTWEQGFRILKDTIGYDGVVSKKGFLSKEGTVYIPTLPEQIKNVDNLTPTDNPDINLSLSEQNEIAPTGQRGTYGKDVRLEVEEAIAPLQETIENLTEQLNTVVDRLEQSNVGNIDTAPVSQEVVEQQGQEAFNNITENEMPPSFEDLSDIIDVEGTTPEATVESPFDNRDIDEVGNRKVKAYQYENPEVRPYFQQEAQNMLYDLDNTIKGEKGAGVDEFGEYHYYGITRQTTEAIAYLKDNYGYSYDQIRKGLNDIIEDNGKENNAVAKRIEFMLDERLREGYTTSDGYPIPPNQEYINFLNEKQITEYNKEAFNALSDNDIPVDVAPIEASVENIVPEQTRMTVEPNNIQTEQIIPSKENMAQNVNMDVIKAKQRSWAETSTESDVIKGKISLNDLDAEKINYMPITNKATLAKANERLSTLGYERALKQFNNDMGSGKMLKPEDITLGQRLIQEALAKGDKATAIELLQDITILGTELGQVTQALSIIQKMTPAGQLRMLEKTVQRGKLKNDKAFKGLELTDDMKNRIMECYNKDGKTYDQDKLNETMEEIKQELADQMPVTKMEKVNAWRYFAMLGNPKTHIRNLVSNVAMKGTVAVKNAVARTIESIAPIENRTKTWKAASEEVKDFAKQTALEMKDVISGENQISVKADIKSKRKIFKTELLNKITNGNSDLMSKEDWWFSKGAFESSFREFLTANGISTQEDIQNNAELVEKGKQYAVEQAQIATFRQYSWLSNKINEIEKKNAATQIAVGSVLPFKKTPINIAKTGLSYSPLGFAKTLTYDVAQVKKGDMEASTLIDHLAQNTTGTALTLIGYMLAQMGFLNGAGEDDKEGKYDYQLGKQGYSLNIGGNTYSLSWLSPIAMPMMVGANAHEILVEKEEWNPDVVIETLGQTLDPLSEMSFLSSLTDTLSSYESGGVQKLWGMAEAAIKNYTTQFVPTLSSQIAGTIDDTKRTTKVSGDSTFKLGEELYNQLIYKIPGLRQTLEPSTDIWGNEIKQNENLFARAFENFISPYSRKENIATEIDEELKDLYSQTGDNGILPNIPYNYVNYDGEKYKMSAEEYTDYKKTYGQTANDLLEDLFRTTTYKNADSEERTDMVNDVYDYARDVAHKEYLAKEGVSYTNTTDDGKEVYKDNAIKGAIENDMSVDEYRMYEDDPEEYKFLMEKDYDYRQKYFDTYSSLKDIEKSFEAQQEATDDDEELDSLSADKKTNIIESIVNSGLEDTEKASLYKKYYNTDTVDNMIKSAISIDDYLTYETKEFKADKNAKGNSIPGSRKEKVVDYVFSLEGLNTAQKAILIKSTNTFKYNDYNAEIVAYVDSLDNIDYDEKIKLLEDLDMTLKGDRIFWE